MLFLSRYLKFHIAHIHHGSADASGREPIRFLEVYACFIVEDAA